ncbi:MAG: ATP-binding protein [Planctomycetes bacterium]|nr:ATP-binding protein [Planctomycetota bacterium]
MIICADDVVGTLESRIAEKVGPQRFNVWFRNATRFTITESYLRVSAPNPFVGEWIERHFADVIREAAAEVTGQPLTLSFDIDPALAKGLGKKQPDRQVDYVANNPERLAREKRRNGDLPRSPKLKGKLEDFVVGPSNRLAHAAAVSVIERPATDYNPLFIHGGCGLGKTHLLQAICNALAERTPDFRWRYVYGEEFTNDFVFATKAREMSTFRERYRNLDLLVIDDVHYFANKKATQEAFLATFNSIEAAGKQIVLASDAHPKMIGHFSDSLVSRFVAGMVVRIDSPDVSVRAEVLRRRAAKLRVEIGEQLEADPAVGLRKRLLRGERVDAHVEYLYTGGLVVVLVLTEPFKLIRSATREAERVEHQNDRVAAQFAQLDRFVAMRRQRKVRRFDA